ncbi:MAG: hypothetical protein AB1473_05135 [Thermodesulfobacteriota bacterium]
MATNLKKPLFTTAAAARHSCGPRIEVRGRPRNPVLQVWYKAFHYPIVEHLDSRVRGNDEQGFASYIP